VSYSTPPDPTFDPERRMNTFTLAQLEAAGQQRIPFPDALLHVSGAAIPEPLPVDRGPAVLPYAIAAMTIFGGAYADDVVVDLKQRAKMGEQKYGTPLRLNNGRNALMDLYQEILDALMYCTQLNLQRSDLQGGQFNRLAVVAAHIRKELNDAGA